MLPFLFCASKVMAGMPTPAAAAAAPAPPHSSKLRRLNFFIAHYLLVWITQIGEDREQISMLADKIARNRALCDQIQLDVNDIIGQLTPIEKPGAAGVIVGQDVWQQNASDSCGIGVAVAKRLQRGYKAVLKVRAVLG